MHNLDGGVEMARWQLALIRRFSRQTTRQLSEIQDRAKFDGQILEKSWGWDTGVPEHLGDDDKIREERLYQCIERFLLDHLPTNSISQTDGFAQTDLDGRCM